MKTALYLSNRVIQAVTGRDTGRGIVIKNRFEIQAPEGSIINGVITDEEKLASCLKTFWREKSLPKRKVICVLNSSRFRTKVMKLPVMSRKETLKYMEREFTSEAFAPEEYQALGMETAGGICGFFEIRRDQNRKMREIFAVRADRAFIETYLSMFRKIGVRPAAIEAALGCAVRALRRIPELKDKTCVVQVRDGDSLNNIMLTDGKYFHSGVSRILSGHGTPEYGREAAGSVGGLLQFVSAQKEGTMATHLYWAGLSGEDQAGCEESVRRLDETLHTKTLCCRGLVAGEKPDCNPESDISGYLFPIGGLLNPIGDYNLYGRYRETAGDLLARRRFYRRLAPAAVLLAFCIIVTGILNRRYHSVRERLAELTEYNSDPGIMEEALEYESLAALRDTYVERLDSYEKAMEMIDACPVYDSSVERAVKSCADGLVNAEILAFRASDGSVSVQVFSDNVGNIHSFLQKLGQQALFKEVAYDGYVYQDNASAWVLDVTCYLADKAGV